jgi:hypothetical protein
MNKTAPLGGGAAASADEERSKKPFNNLAAPTPQYPAKHVYRAAALLRCAPPDPGIIPGGIRDRAMRAMIDRIGPLNPTED